MWDGVVDAGSRGRFTIHDAFPLSLVMGEQELLNVFQTLVMHVCVQVLKDRVSAICKNMGPCVEVGAFGLPPGGKVSRMGKGIFGPKEVFVTGAHVLRIIVFGMMEVPQKVLERLWSSEVLFVHL